MKMKYGIYAEDAPFKNFIETIVFRLLTDFQQLEATYDTAFSEQEKPTNGVSQFMKEFVPSLTKGIIDYQLDFCILALDCDEFELVDLKGQINQKLIENNLADNGVICIARKSIEFWMWYCQAEKDNLPIIDIYADFNNQTMKLEVYGRKRSGSRGVLKAKELAENVTISFLKEKSESFKSFFEEFKLFIDKNI